MCASLGADGTLTITPATLGSVDGVYWISEMGYESAVEVSWNDARDEVKSIEPYAFESAPNIQMLYVRSSKLKKRSKVASCLAYSNVSWVWVSGMSSTNVRKVVNAFNSWAWVG